MKWYIYVLFVGTNRAWYRCVDRVNIGRERGKKRDSRVENVAIDKSKPFLVKAVFDWV